MPRLKPKRTVTITVEYEVVERPSSIRSARARQQRWPSTRPLNGTAEDLTACLEEYFTSEDQVLDDYGPEAWGGYDGAFITAARILDSKVS